MKCPKCEAKMDLKVELIGGCNCPSDSDDYCYCDSADVRAYWLCHGEFISRKGRATGRCYHREPIHKLGDRGAIERYLQKHYTE